MTNLQALAYAMKMEKESAKYYHQYAGKCKSKNSITIFETLAKMETEHYEILEKQYHALSTGGSWIAIDLLKFDLPEMFLEKNRARVTENELESELSEITILRMAYLMENDLAIFYKEWSEKTEEPIGKAFFKKLSDWENEHYNMLYKESKTLLEDNWFEMGFAPF